MRPAAFPFEAVPVPIAKHAQRSCALLVSGLIYTELTRLAARRGELVRILFVRLVMDTFEKAISVISACLYSSRLFSNNKTIDLR